MKTTFFLVRHALKEKRIGDVPITSEGVVQAKSTALRLANVSVTKIIASPLQRAIDTAAHIAHQTNVTVMEDPRLRERANWGDLPEQTFEEFIAMWDRCTIEPDYLPPVGDSSKQAGERLASFLAELTTVEPPDSHIVIVTHGGLITDFLVNTFPELELNVWHPNFIAMQSQLIPECSITTLIHENGKYTIQDFASVAHLK
ncbi:2,3-bisphosphoglycerate-dependent phosphoglycerate mutase/probable phosphoglycerate mutase [Paenibacillus sp. RU5A]|nr:2,3-bisphosphoglycerate-dependent phosphoglycerate mutase/probable phosphoglycerate mutase [Paenibacillus sp. RU5A]SOC68853.1 2,3-bisphosphoglycerate-dependent phosphoglycerate mutase/probable phosphoglycerate mutase [Paenibacillus sp. RU26A]SOC71300.1 2,3-bisphosphoglycerate-dependent phosphoglycerate mutase/probable phosphoglycerate mutase [Paenibacillus sp. RU5M]